MGYRLTDQPSSIPPGGFRSEPGRRRRDTRRRARRMPSNNRSWCRSGHCTQAASLSFAGLCTLGGMGREYFVNADFDLTLRRGREPSPTGARDRQVEEAAFHLLLLGVGGDSVIVNMPPDLDFLSYLEGCGISPPETSVRPSIRRDSCLTPFGWNRQAAELNLRYATPSAHPPLAVVRRVNGRRFAASVELELFDDGASGVLASVDAIEEWVAGHPKTENGWIVKSEHGNSGLGNRRLPTSDLSETDRRVIRRLLSEDESVLIEPFRRRVLDLSSVFEVDTAGRARGLHLHEVVNTADGAFIGGFFEPDSPTLAPWREGVADVVDLVATRLAEAGYFGPVCLDSFVLDDGGRQRLRPVVDINARRHMSAAALALWRAWDRDRVVLWRLFSSRKLRLPTSYDEFARILGVDAFELERRRGTLLTSPLEMAGRRLLRVSVLFAGASREEVEGLESRFRELFER